MNGTGSPEPNVGPVHDIDGLPDKTGLHKWQLQFQRGPICLNCGHQVKRYEVGPYGHRTPRARASQTRNAMRSHEKACWK